MAALLACGPAAAVSDRSAAAVWDDVLWRSLAFGIEIDGYDGHGGRVAFERDRLKVATLKAHGLSVMLITPGKLRDDPKAVLARLLSALALAGYRR